MTAISGYFNHMQTSSPKFKFTANGSASPGTKARLCQAALLPVPSESWRLQQAQAHGLVTSTNALWGLHQRVEQPDDQAQGRPGAQMTASFLLHLPACLLHSECSGKTV